MATFIKRARNKTRTTEGRKEEEGRSMTHGGRKEEPPNSSFIRLPNPEGTNRRTNVLPEDTPGLIIQTTTTIILLLQPYPTPFYPCKAFPLCGFWCWPGSFIQCIFDNVVGHLPLFFHITFMYCAISGSLEISDVPGRHHITSESTAA